MWVFRAQSASHGLSGLLRDLCDKVAQARVLPGSGLSSSVVSPRNRHRELPPKQELFRGTKSLPHVLFALGCSGPDLLGWETDLWWQFSSIWTAPQVRLGQSFPNTRSAEDLNRKRQTRKGTALGNPLLSSTWMGHVSDGKGNKARKNKWLRGHSFPFVQLKGLIYESCKPYGLEKIWPYGKVSYCCLGWRECTFGLIVRAQSWRWWMGWSQHRGPTRGQSWLQSQDFLWMFFPFVSF